MRVWPWSELAYLRRELRAVKLSCSAEMKRCNRLTERARVLDAACRKHKGQERHDQAYIDALEANVMPADLARIREQMSTSADLARSVRESATKPGTRLPTHPKGET